MNGGNNFSNLPRVKKGRGSATEVDGIKGAGKISDQAHLFQQRPDKRLSERWIGYRIEIAVRTLFYAKRDMDV